MSLKPIVLACGGELYAGGRRASIPAPGHSPHDRSISLLWVDGRVIVHSFGAADWRDALEELRNLGLVDADGRLLSTPPRQRREPPTLTTVEREAAARALWEQGRAIAGTLSETYLRRRRILRPLPEPSALRHHGSVPLAVYSRSRDAKPAMLAAVRDSTGQLTAVEVTYLDAGGARARWPRVSRKTIGRLYAGAAVQLDAAGPELLVAEGVATALSGSELLALPAWALLSTGNLRKWRPPQIVRRVVIAADSGRDGEASAELLASRLRRAGVSAEIRPPPAPFGDWNDAAAGSTAAGKGR